MHTDERGMLALALLLAGCAPMTKSGEGEGTTPCSVKPCGVLVSFVLARSTRTE
jgi:hypothetical protein